MRNLNISKGLATVVAIFALTLTMLVISAPAAAQTEAVLYNFNGYGTGGAPYQPYSGVILDSSGNIYGTTFQGGTFGHGTVYELSPLAGGGLLETILYNFNETKGSVGYGPQASLTFDAAGNLYGTRSTEGANGEGMIFELSSATGGGWTEAGLHSFNGKNGDYPESALIKDGDGNFYSTTDFGGAYGYGAVYELSPITGGGWMEKLLHSFQHSKHDGMNPSLGSLVTDSAGNIYGTAQAGGANVSPKCQEGCGTVFELSPVVGGHWTEKLLYSFNSDGTDGMFPGAGVILDGAGNLYGTTFKGGTGSCKTGSAVTGCGTLFKLSPEAGGTWTESIVHSFEDNITDGQYPQPGAGLVMNGAGDIFGTTGFGGIYGNGTVFEFSLGAGGTLTETILHSFHNNGTDGYGPGGNLVLDSAGNLYGVTTAGGSAGGSGGTVYEVTP